VKLQTVILARVFPLLLLFAISSPAHAGFAHQVVNVQPGAGAALTCRLDQISPPDRKLDVSCAMSIPPAHRLALRFTDQFAGIDRLSERIFSLKVRDEQGAVLPLEIRGGGLYFFPNAGRPQTVTITYQARLARVLDPSQYALISSLGPQSGFLYPGDLLPRLCAVDQANCAANPVKLQVIPPSAWKIATTEKATGGFFEIAAPQRALICLSNFRERTVTANSMSIRLIVAGAWDSSDEEIFKLAELIAREQAAIVESGETGDFLVALAPFPLPLTGLRSSAVTIGRTVVLQLNSNSDSAQTFAHFRRHLAHEMFHFYLPNSFRIRENFDWFWEGFTRYVALLTLARLRLIDFQAYLDAIGEEYAAYAFNPARAQISLIAASPEKFASLAVYDLVYRKGMLVAALYDLELRWQSKGRYSLTDVMRGLYQKYARRGVEAGNSEVLNELNRLGDFKRLIRDDIEGVSEIKIVERLKPYGLDFAWSPATRGKVTISRSAKLSERQRYLFDGLASER
jgi:predicted metalloprotease with PDZ domain